MKDNTKEQFTYGETIYKKDYPELAKAVPAWIDLETNRGYYWDGTKWVDIK